MLVLPDGKQQKEAEALVKEWLSKSGGKVVSVDFWGKKDLVYPIKKQIIKEKTEIIIISFLSIFFDLIPIAAIIP